jgi:hypothetical protein
MNELRNLPEALANALGNPTDMVAMVLVCTLILVSMGIYQLNVPRSCEP